ncbi:hypothetical protein ACIBLA_28940 [Streptomyces sp. NPDC050433]
MVEVVERDAHRHRVVAVQQSEASARASAIRSASCGCAMFIIAFKALA